MPKFKVYWSKAYYRNGSTVLEADDAAHAYDLADEQIGDWIGSLQYYPDDNMIDIEELADE